jgi:hypothetical protein
MLGTICLQNVKFLQIIRMRSGPLARNYEKPHTRIMVNEA